MRKRNRNNGEPVVILSVRIPVNLSNRIQDLADKGLITKSAWVVRTLTRKDRTKIMKISYRDKVIQDIIKDAVLARLNNIRDNDIHKLLIDYYVNHNDAYITQWDAIHDVYHIEFRSK